MSDVPTPKNLSVEILKQIRGELKQSNQRLDALGDRVDAMREELGHRIVESELRTATAISELAGTVRDMTSVLRQQADLRPRVERCEQDIAELKRLAPSR